MKYAFMTFSTPQLSLEQVLDVARKYGYDGVELRLDSKHAHGIEAGIPKEKRAGAKRLAAQKGIAYACVATSLKFADAKAVEATLNGARERIDLAADLGAPAIRVFGGKLAEGQTREAAIELMAKSLRAIADHAAERGVAVCLETHDDWCNPEHVAAVMRQANHPAIAVNWDIMHPVRNAGVPIEQAFNKLKPWIRHCHAHDGVEQGKGGSGLAHMGEGIIDHRLAMRLLKGANYAGYLSGEWIKWEPYDVHLPREIATLKRFEQEL